LDLEPVAAMIRFVVAPDGKIRYSVVGDVNWADDTAVKEVLRLVPVR